MISCMDGRWAVKATHTQQPLLSQGERQSQKGRMSLLAQMLLQRNRASSFCVSLTHEAKLWILCRVSFWRVCSRDPYLLSNLLWPRHRISIDFELHPAAELRDAIAWHATLGIPPARPVEGVLCIILARPADYLRLSTLQKLLQAHPTCLLATVPWRKAPLLPL